MTPHHPRRRGRPQKFGRPSQPVTITLPDDVVAAFRAVDRDLSRAIVNLAETAAARMIPRPDVEVSRYGHSAVIVLKPNKAVARLPGVALVPLPDGRALISLDRDKGVAEFEVLVRDALEAEEASAVERATLQQLGDILRAARRSRRVKLSQRNIIVLEATTGTPDVALHAANRRRRDRKGETDR